MMIPFSQYRQPLEMPEELADQEVDGFTFTAEQLADELYVVSECASEMLPEDLVVVNGQEMLSPERSLLDLACCTRAVDFWRMVDNCLARRLTTPLKVLQAVERHPEHKGGPRLTIFVRAWCRHAPYRPDSEMR